MSAAAPLAGVRVLDLSRVLAGPYCSMVLADLGADVIKIERPGAGDPTRAWGPPFRAGESAYYLCINRGKRSVTVDLADPAGVEVVRRLALGSDVVIESFLPGGAERLGLGYEALSALRPKLVYASIAGYSPESVDARRPGFDFAIQGEAGGMSITGEPDGPPLKVGVAIADITTGMFATIGTLAALRAAELTDRGHHVQVSLYDSQLAWLANRGSDWLVAGEEPQRLGNAHPAIVPYEAFETSDGFVIVAVGTNEQYARFCSGAGLAELAADERYATNALRVEHRLELVGRLASAIRERPTAEWLAILAEANVPGGPVRTIPEAFAHAPYAVMEHAHPTLGTVRTVRSPIGVDGTYHTAAAAPPLLGQHTDEVLAELGYDDAARTALMRGACRLA
ncbi:MAG TPA: CoA transferase [Gaiellales bacterium]|jgi:crotonobetainyl-CoA:carnitine CoA-transferase CaiB-like acyl-CoA transferase|nr:CoA transferase [Gaiellales bacterium]